MNIYTSVIVLRCCTNVYDHNVPILKTLWNVYINVIKFEKLLYALFWIQTNE